MGADHARFNKPAVFAALAVSRMHENGLLPSRRCDTGLFAVLVVSKDA